MRYWYELRANEIARDREAEAARARLFARTVHHHEAPVPSGAPRPSGRIRRASRVDGVAAWVTDRWASRPGAAAR